MPQSIVCEIRNILKGFRHRLTTYLKKNYIHYIILRIILRMQPLGYGAIVLYI